MPDLTPDTPDVVAQAPQSKVGGDAFAVTPRAGTVGLSPGLEALGAGLEDVAVPLAKAQAQQDVASFAAGGKGMVRDANGTPQVATPDTSLILGRAGQAYDETVRNGVQASLASTVSQQLTDAHAAAEKAMDPQSFLVRANGIAETYRQLYPGAVGNGLATQAHNEASQRYASLVEQKAKMDVHEGLQAVQTRIDVNRH